MLQAASLFNQLLHHFPRTEFGALDKRSTKPSAAPKGSPVGPSSCRCRFANWLMPIRSARSVTVWPAVRANWFIWAS